MTTTAIVVLVLSLVVVWGGLVLSILNLRRAPQDSTDRDVPDEPSGGGAGADGEAAI